MLLQETCLLLYKMQLSKLTKKPLMMTILYSLTLLTLKHHKRHQTQQISVTWNLEVLLQFLDDRKKDLEMLTVVLLLDL